MSKIKSTTKGVATFVAMLAIGYGLGEGISYAKYQFNTPPPMSAFEIMDTTAHFAQTDKKVIVYGTQWCPHCKRAKQYLNDNRIAYELRDIEQGSDEEKALYGSLQRQGVPQIIIGAKVFAGFNQALIAEELKKQGMI